MAGPLTVGNLSVFTQTATTADLGNLIAGGNLSAEDYAVIGDVFSDDPELSAMLSALETAWGDRREKLAAAIGALLADPSRAGYLAKARLKTATLFASAEAMRASVRAAVGIPAGHAAGGRAAPTIEAGQDAVLPRRSRRAVTNGGVTAEHFKSDGAGGGGGSTSALPVDGHQDVDDAAVLARGILKAKARLRVEHGSLPPDHPAQEYVSRLAARLPIRDGLVPRVFILPEWGGIDAMSFPDGTIYISSGLLRHVESSEALLGVIAHEYVHAYRQHVEKKRAIDDTSFLKRTLQLIGMARAHEYEADLRGALEILDAIGVSPVPVQRFLEKLYSIERRKGQGITHGSAMDRSLNIQAMTYLVDHRGIDARDFEPVPEGLYREVVQAKRATLAASDFGLDELPFLMERQGMFKEALTRFVGLLPVPEGFNDHQRAIFTFACLALFADLRWEIWMGEDGDLKDFPYARPENLIQSPEDLESLYQSLENLLAVPAFSFTYGHTSDFWWRLLRIVGENGIFQDPGTKEWDAKELKAFVERWAILLSRASARWDTEDIWVPRDYVDHSLRRNWVPRDYVHHPLHLNRKSNPMMVARLREIFREGALPMNEELKGIANGLAGFPLHRIDKALRKAGKKVVELLERHGATTLEDLGRAVTAISGIIFDRTVSPDYDPDRRTVLGISTYAHLGLLEIGLDTAPWLRDIPRTRKKAILLAAALRNGLTDEKGNLDKLIRDYGDYSDPSLRKGPKPEDSWGYYTSENLRQLQRVASVMGGFLSEDGLYLDTPSEEDAFFVGRLMTDNPFFRTQTGISEILPSMRPTAAAVHYLSRYLTSFPIADILATFDRWKAAGGDMEAVLAGHPEGTGLMALHLVDAFETGELEGLPLAGILRVSRWIANPFLQDAFERHFTEGRWGGLSFEGRLDITFPASGRGGVRNSVLRDRFIEEDVRTQEGSGLARRRVNASIDYLLSEPRTEAGIAVLLDINMRHRNVVGLLQALLQSHLDERALKETLLEWMGTIGEASETVEEFARVLAGVDRAIRLIYSMDDLARQMLLRKLLAGEGGAVSDRNRRDTFYHMLFRQWISPRRGEEDILNLLGSLQGSLAGVADWPLLYFAIQGVLSGKIGNPPPKGAPWRDIYAVQEALGGVDEGKETPTGMAVIDRVAPAKLSKDMQRRPWRYAAAIAAYAERQMLQALEKRGAMAAVADAGTMTPLGFVKEAASRMGAMGVRFLQLLPLIVELKDEYRAEFETVYDRVRGQSKLAALYLLEREWHDFWQEIAEVGDRLGGGSMVTVYRARSRSGEAEVVKVRNPNIKYHLGQAYGVAKEVLDNLVRKSSNGSAYRAARLLLDDILKWVVSDADFENFLQHDFAFREWVERNPFEWGGYSIYIPRSKGPASPFFAREEYVESKNLTQWETLVAEGHDMRGIVTLLARFYLAQIANGQVLSDVHVGNFGVTSDRRVAVFDRNFYLHLSEDEQRLVRLFLSSLEDAGSREDALYRYLQPDPKLNAAAIRRQISEVVSGLTVQDWKKAQRGLIQLKQQGVKMPLTLTLLLKNFQALHQLARRAGFNNLFEAVLGHTAPSN